MNDIYRRQVALLIRVMPLVFKIKDFAVHGGTAINLFHRNLPRYSVDIDVTYIPLEDREASLKNINKHLSSLKAAIEKAVPGIRVTHKPDVWKLQCVKDGTTIKIEVNGTKRGIPDKTGLNKANLRLSASSEVFRARIFLKKTDFGPKKDPMRPLLVTN